LIYYCVSHCALLLRFAVIELWQTATEETKMTFTRAELGRSANENTARTLYAVLADLALRLKLGEYQRVYGTAATREKESQAWAKAHSAWCQATNQDVTITLTVRAAYARYCQREAERVA